MKWYSDVDLVEQTHKVNHKFLKNKWVLSSSFFSLMIQQHDNAVIL